MNNGFGFALDSNSVADIISGKDESQGTKEGGEYF
jgi:hypothetical protein